MSEVLNKEKHYEFTEVVNEKGEVTYLGYELTKYKKAIFNELQIEINHLFSSSENWMEFMEKLNKEIKEKCHKKN